MPFSTERLARRVLSNVHSRLRVDVRARCRACSLWQLDVQFKDGQAELGIEAARELGICELKEEMRWRSRRYLFSITQFRGLLYAPSSDETVLVAG